MNNKKQPTIYDIAEYLGISTGTVYRALNNKGRISEQTKQKVLETAAELGYKANKAAQSLRRNPIYIGVILCCPISQYLREIKQGIEAAFEELSQFNVFCDIRDLGCCNADDCEDEIFAALDSFEEKSYQGMVLFLSGKNTAFNDKLTALQNEGMKIAAVANDIDSLSKAVYVSADGRACGRLAAEILSLACENKRIAILTGNRSMAIHKSKVSGFCEYAEKNSSFSSIDIYEHSDTELTAREMIDKMFSSALPPDGIYITSAISQYTCKYINEMSLAARPKIITTDLFDENRDLLASGATCATIFQNPFKQGKKAVLKLYDYIVENHTGEESYPLIPQAVFASIMKLYDSDTN